MRSIYGRALCHVSEILLIEFRRRWLRRGGGVSCSGVAELVVDLGRVLVLCVMSCEGVCVCLTYDFRSIVSLSRGGDAIRSTDAEADRDSGGESACGCGFSGVTVLSLRLSLFCFGFLCFVFVSIGATSSLPTGPSSLAAEVILALRFSLFLVVSGMCMAQVRIYICDEVTWGWGWCWSYLWGLSIIKQSDGVSICRWAGCRLRRASLLHDVLARSSVAAGWRLDV